VRVAPLVASDPAQGLVWTLVDETAQWEQRQGPVADALHDPLTGALNRLGLSSALQPLLARDLQRQPLGVMCLSLNGLKTLGERHGPLFTDRVLSTTHERLKRALRGNDLIARVGPDEFIVVLDPLEDARQAASIAERVSEVIAAPMLLEGAACQVQTAIGLALAPMDASTADALIETSSRAMHEMRRVLSPVQPWRAVEQRRPDRRSPR
jgi:diguanylate cyclase (GGDEF)-like protein